MKNENRERALRLAARNGRVWAGSGNSWDRGATYRVHASTIRSLVGIGLLERVVDDGVAAVLTEKGRTALAELDAALEGFRKID